MNNCISYSPRASLAIVGMNMQQMGIWQMIGQQVKIQQKTVIHTPLQKLQDAFINIMAGGEGIVEVNQRVKTDAGLSAAFGRQRCADQSGVSTTLNACQADNIEQMRQAMAIIYQRYGAGYRHDYGRSWQLLDIDMSGMPAGRQGDGVEKGYFAKQKNKRGRQLGRVYATLYDEIVTERLYCGKTQLNRSLLALVADAETVLNLNPGFRKRTILRIDGGGGNDSDINWLLQQRYQLLVKVTHWKRVEKLVTTVETWHTDPKDPRRQAGWVETPFAYDQPTRQLAVRCQTKKGKWRTAILVFNLDDDQLGWLNQQGKRPLASPADPIWLAVYAYDLRGGAVEIAIKGSKQGLGITKRNKKSFHAQEMLLLLGQLAYNVISWVRNGLASCRAKLQQFGMLRMVRDAFHIPGRISFDAHGHLVQISLNQAYDLAAAFITAFASFLARDGTVANLRQI
ncbi:MAG: transposase [Ardenticatenaceae bacterium]|nr:transposase [Ardenticatenaceae bacterium]